MSDGLYDGYRMELEARKPIEPVAALRMLEENERENRQANEHAEKRRKDIIQRTLNHCEEEVRRLKSTITVGLACLGEAAQTHFQELTQAADHMQKLREERDRLYVELEQLKKEKTLR